MKIDPMENIGALDVGPKFKDRDSNEQKVNRDGVPEWTVEALYRPARGRAQVFNVTVASEDEPEIVPTVSRFAGLTISSFEGENGTVVFYRADGVEA